MKKISLKLLMFLLYVSLVIFLCSFYNENKINAIKNEGAITKPNHSSSYLILKQQKPIKKVSKQYTSKKTSDTIYAQKDVTNAVPSLDNQGFINLVKENFKYPTSLEPVNGTILADLIIEKDGTISDVIIVDGLHQDLDKEAIRVLKLMPKFEPGKKNGQSVRSKLRMSVFCVAKQ